MFAVGLASYKIKPSQPTCFWIGPTPTEQLDRSGYIRITGAGDESRFSALRATYAGPRQPSLRL